MIVIIARDGNFALRRKNFLGDHIYTTHDIEIVKYKTTTDVIEIEREYCYTIASFNEDGELVSCGDRLLTAITDDIELSQVKALAEIGTRIIQTDFVKTDYSVKSKTIKLA